MTHRDDAAPLAFTDRALLAATLLLDLRTYADAHGLRLSYSGTTRPMLLALSLGRCEGGCAPRGPMRWDCCDYRRLAYAAQEMVREARA